MIVWTYRTVRLLSPGVLGAGYHDDGWIFCRPDGTPIHPERFSREFLRKQEAHNKAHPEEALPRLKLHGLRHTWATLALEDGIDIHVVSDRLDHSSIHITSQIYTHVRRPLQSDAADRVAARIFAKPTRENAALSWRRSKGKIPRPSNRWD